MISVCNKSKIPASLIWLLPAIATYSFFRFYFPYDRTLAQLAAFPFCFLAILAISLVGRSIPKSLLIISALLSVAIALSPYIFIKNASLRVFVERFDGDTLGSRTHIFIEALNSSFEQLGSVRATEWRSLENGKAEKTESINKRNEVILKGDDRLLIAKLGRSNSIILNQINFPGRFLAATQLELVTWVPVISLSTQPYQATADYLTSLLSGALPHTKLELGAVIEKDDSVLSQEQEILLWSSTFRSDRWRSASHRALPAWILGNRFLVEAFKSGAIDMAELQCALKSYEIAAKFMRYGDNPELFAAINNNRGVAWYLVALITGKQEYRSYARKYLSLANQSMRQPNLFRLQYYSGHIARRNLARLGISGANVNMGRNHKLNLNKSKKHVRRIHSQAAIRRSTQRDPL